MEDNQFAIELWGECGFNVARIMWGFQTNKFFNDLEASKINLKVLKYFDRIIETEIKYDMHK